LLLLVLVLSDGAVSASYDLDFFLFTNSINTRLMVVGDQASALAGDAGGWQGVLELAWSLLVSVLLLLCVFCF
jgi:hypothetical protein